MITSLDIVGFKRFERQVFDFAPLTILAGLNGSGKTTVIQALLLTWAAAADVPGSDIVRLNGPFGLALGTAEDVRNWQSDDAIEFRLLAEEGLTSAWKFDAPSDEALYLKVVERAGSLPDAFLGEPRAFSYLCAERLGPRGALEASALPAHSVEVGVSGEYCAQILAMSGNEPLAHPDRLHPDTGSTTSLLKYQIEHWLSELTRPIEIDGIWYPGSTVTSLRFRSPGGEWVRATNMGFGVSYALPIVLAGLTARENGLLIVENPEAHLHPAGQSRMGVFLAWLASKGVQVLVETHSDHVLNGIRLAVGRLKYLAPPAAIVHFFEADDKEPKIHKLGFTPIGGVSHWPKGFFDQYQIDVASLGRIRRSN